MVQLNPIGRLENIMQRHLPPPTPHQHHTPPHHTTRTLPHPPTTHTRRTHHPRTQNHRQLARTQHLYPNSIPNRYYRHFQRDFDPDAACQHLCQHTLHAVPVHQPYCVALDGLEHMLHEGRLARQRPQRPLRQPRLASLRNSGLDCQPAAGACVAQRGRTHGATAAVRRRRAGRHPSVGHAGCAEHGLLGAHAQGLARGCPAALKG
jgi:hypothetical protein